MKSIRAAVAGEIKAELARRNLSQKLLTKVWGVTESSVSNKLNGHSRLSTEEVAQAVAALGFDPFEFVARVSGKAGRSPHLDLPA